MKTLFRQHFPFFTQYPDWTYLDSAATTLKPQVLLDATQDFYCSAGSVHRSQYDLPQSQAYERARALLAKRFNVEANSVIWTSGTTHAINIVANGIADHIHAGDEIVISVAEHHANFVPWQQLATRKRANLKVLTLNDDQQIDLNALTSILSPKTKIVALHLISNVSGVRQPIEQIISLIRQHSHALILCDIAQAACSEALDLTQLDADFYALSAHKMYGPTGVGALIGKPSALQPLRPLCFGGKMLKSVTTEQLRLAEIPYCFEAGTPNIAGIIGFGEVLHWLNQWDFPSLNQQLTQLGQTAYQRLTRYPQLQVVGQGKTTFSFYFNHYHHADIAAILNEQHIALRSGEHCAQPYLQALNQQGTLRISLAHYNQAEDLDRFFAGLDLALAMLE